MTALSTYIRNIAVFLIFSSFITIIVPSKKYEQYINLILGTILVFLIASPLAGIIGSFSSGSGNIFRDMTLQYDRAVLSRQIADANEAGIEAILADYRNALTEQLGRIVANHGSFTLHHAHFTIDTDENFGEILSIHAILSEGTTTGRPPLISIDPVRIDLAINTRGQPAAAEDAESPQIMSLKKAISDFYKLDTANIILETREN